MIRKPLLWYIRQLRRPVFTSRELSSFSGRSLSAIAQALGRLADAGLVIRLRRGLWADAGAVALGPYALVGFLAPGHRCYVSFISALHLQGIIEQIPQVVTIATTAHTKTINTALGVFRLHQIDPDLFGGFGWYKGTGSFLIAEPEKALADSIYLSTRRKKQFGSFPELHLPETFDRKKAMRWIGKIHDPRIRVSATTRLTALLATQKK